MHPASGAQLPVDRRWLERSTGLQFGRGASNTFNLGAEVGPNQVTTLTAIQSAASPDTRGVAAHRMSYDHQT
jgi:hypothetical protein